VHVAPACAGSEEGSDHFGSYVLNLSLHLCKLFPKFEPMTSWLEGNNFTIVPGIPFKFHDTTHVLNSSDHNKQAGEHGNCAVLYLNDYVR
jgi:hypothetical protein